MSMLFKILQIRNITAEVPHNFSRDAMYGFLNNVLDEQGDAKCSRITFDFKTMAFIEPVGVVVLSNLLEHLKKLNVKVRFAIPDELSSGLIYLDDTGFFRQYRGKPLRAAAKVRLTTVPLEIVKSEGTQHYLYSTLIPWVGRNVGLSSDSLQTIRACLEEIFQNITDHSGINLGCVFAQHFPNKNEIQIAISDFGIGIPKMVARKLTGVPDQRAILEACKEGFTTKSNVRNRGAGLPNLMRYVTSRNNGRVVIASGRGELSAVMRNGMKLTPRASRGYYPGTLVTTVLRTDTIEAVASDVQPEDFEW